jgi:hypothetical protein
LIHQNGCACASSASRHRSSRSLRFVFVSNYFVTTVRTYSVQLIGIDVSYLRSSRADRFIDCPVGCSSALCIRRYLSTVGCTYVCTYVRTPGTEYLFVRLLNPNLVQDYVILSSLYRNGRKLHVHSLTESLRKGRRTSHGVTYILDLDASAGGARPYGMSSFSLNHS